MKMIFGKKIGMTHFFLDSGKMVAVNVIQCEPMSVLRRKTVAKDGYSALVVGFEKTDKKNKKPLAGQFKDNVQYKYIREIPLKNEKDGYKVGDELRLDLLEKATLVNVQGVSKGKGFAGTIKRYNFNRGPMTHGHDHHRAPGAISSGTTPGRVRKNTKMAGRMGHKTVSVMAQKLVKIDKENNLLFIQGSVPGGKNSLVMIKETAKK